MGPQEEEGGKGAIFMFESSNAKTGLRSLFGGLTSSSHGCWEKRRNDGGAKKKGINQTTMVEKISDLHRVSCRISGSMLSLHFILTVNLRRWDGGAERDRTKALGRSRRMARQTPSSVVFFTIVLCGEEVNFGLAAGATGGENAVKRNAGHTEKGQGRSPRFRTISWTLRRAEGAAGKQ